MKTLEIEDWYDHGTCMRYGGIQPAHAGIQQVLAKNMDHYAARLAQFSEFTDQFRTFAADREDDTTPFWKNGFFPFLDVVALFGFIAQNKPKRYIEIGSGNSTKVAAYAKQQQNLDTHLISIDPCPRAEIDQLCNEVIRQPLQAVDLSLFDSLDAGDILFFDGSHRVLQNSDNQILFFEIIPALKPGVLIHIHDINWPWDYPEEWTQRYYNEQYVLGAMLLYGAEKFVIEFPGAYAASACPVPEYFGEFWHELKAQGVDMHGCSFWFQKSGD